MVFSLDVTNRPLPYFSRKSLAGPNLARKKEASKSWTQVGEGQTLSLGDAAGETLQSAQNRIAGALLMD
jgi:hypothetical protein